ncbi:hypothetical protein OG689_32005 [Kitasatospora sp. NBC_00240]|uniref:hypothetical protein n=1 Tax=Kitasatospora sp. NBC_00240 TaxID=2903567 RepID=UPI002253796A|nr:hypothetical protein [Kitasatospora sp. NBC_00240]MCX5213840.1 hypothetical protein [Kitasatospora sp. NBC_00240]
MRWSWRSTGPLLACSLLALAGCSGSDPGHASADAGRSASASAQSPDPSPSPSPSPSPTVSHTPPPVADCTDTAAFGQQQLHDYLAKLPSDSGGLNGLHTSYDGVHYNPSVDHRPCKTLYVNVTHFWVVVVGGGRPTFNPGDWSTGIPGFPSRTPYPGVPTSTRTSSAEAEFTYKLISTTPLALTLGAGTVIGSRPPAPETCRGTLTVVHLGDPITDEELPDSLRFEASTLDHGASTVKVKADRAIDATLVPPSSRVGC